jgi:hypothetical protein
VKIKRNWLFFIVIAFPVFFLLHGVNEHFGLLRHVVIGQLLVYYILVGAAIGILCKLMLKNNERSAVFAFLLLSVFFFFGAVKDVMAKAPMISSLTSYRIFLPLTFVFIVACFILTRKLQFTFRRTVLFITTLLVVFLVVETATLISNIATGKEKQKDLGDSDQSLLKQLPVDDSIRKPYIFWIVLDEYTGGSVLRERWNFTNPLDTILRNRQFFVADTARSPYNYTHYSLVSTLDMQYLDGLKEHSLIGFRDIVRGNISLQRTNTVSYLKKLGYNVINQTIYHVDEHPTEAREYFVNADFRLIDNQTLPGRIRQDVGWQFRRNNKAEGLIDESKYRLQLLDDGLKAANTAFQKGTPSMFMYHWMFTHEPFIYNADGSIDTTVGFGMYPEKYVPSINYANKQLTWFIDSLKASAGNREIVIILQGDHGYKFEERDPLFDREGCSILYAIYCSDGRYAGWSNSLNSVNTFRLLFNKYFHTNLPTLENRSFNLYYR